MSAAEPATVEPERDAVATPSAGRRTWLLFALAFAVGLTLVFGGALVQYNQLSPIPTGTLSSGDVLERDGIRFTVVEALHEVSAPKDSAWQTTPNGLPGATWLSAAVDAELLPGVDLEKVGCHLVVRTATGEWEHDGTVGAREEADPICQSTSEPVKVGSVKHLRVFFRVPTKELVNPRLIVVLPGLPAQAFEVLGS